MTVGSALLAWPFGRRRRGEAEGALFLLGAKEGEEAGESPKYEGGIAGEGGGADDVLRSRGCSGCEGGGRRGG